MVKTLTIKCPAKINLFLNITGKTKNNYHTINLINQTINIYDSLIIEKTNDFKITITCDVNTIPLDKTNSIYKAIEVFITYTQIHFTGISVKLFKNIPIMAGLGSESTDAAGILMGLNIIYETSLTSEVLIKIGKMVGSDVPYFIVGGYCHVTGTGQIIVPLVYNPYSYYLLINPKTLCSTKDMFLKYDANVKTYVDRKYQGLMHNDFETIIDFDITTIKNNLLKSGALTAGLTGSGSYVVGSFSDKETFLRAYIKLKEQGYCIIKCKNAKGIKISTL